MDALAAQAGPREAPLRAQLAAITGVEREYTGAGYYLNLSIAVEAPLMQPGGGNLGDVRFELEGVPDGGGAMLWVRDGVLSCMEVYLHGAGPWPEAPRLTAVEPMGDGC